MFSFLTVESAIAVTTFIGGLLGWLWRTAAKATKLETKVENLESDLGDEKHARKNLSQEMKALDNQHQKAIQRIVAVETTVLSLKSAVDRIDQNVIALLKRDS